MKRWAGIALLAIAWAPGQPLGPRVLTWRLGAIDPRFGLTREQALRAATRATEMWDRAANRDLFRYSDSGDLRVDFVFDGRQRRTQDSKRAQTELDAQRTAIQGMRRQHEEGKSALLSQEAEVEDARARYRSRLDGYNREVDRWNSRGGAPADVSQRLETEREDLRTEQSRINRRVEELNGAAEQLNALVDKLNRAVSRFNGDVADFNARYGRSEVDVVGQYTSRDQRICIYAFSDDDELVVTLAHEFGHALGLEHASRDGSVMSAVNRKGRAPAQPKLSSEDLRLLRDHLR